MKKLLIGTIASIMLLNSPVNAEFIKGDDVQCVQGVRNFYKDYFDLNIPWHGNAFEFIYEAKKAGYMVGPEPEPGAIAVWEPSDPVNGFTYDNQKARAKQNAACHKTKDEDGCGHVGVVTRKTTLWGWKYVATNDDGVTERGASKITLNNHTWVEKPIDYDEEDQPIAYIYIKTPDVVIIGDSYFKRAK